MIDSQFKCGWQWIVRGNSGNSSNSSVVVLSLTCGGGDADDGGRPKSEESDAVTQRVGPDSNKPWRWSIMIKKSSNKM